MVDGQNGRQWLLIKLFRNYKQMYISHIPWPVGGAVPKLLIDPQVVVVISYLKMVRLINFNFIKCCRHGPRMIQLNFCENWSSGLEELKKVVFLSNAKWQKMAEKNKLFEKQIKILLKIDIQWSQTNFMEINWLICVGTLTLESLQKNQCSGVLPLANVCVCHVGIPSLIASVFFPPDKNWICSSECKQTSNCSELQMWNTV